MSAYFDDPSSPTYGLNSCGSRDYVISCSDSSGADCMSVISVDSQSETLTIDHLATFAQAGNEGTITIDVSVVLADYPTVVAPETAQIIFTFSFDCAITLLAPAPTLASSSYSVQLYETLLITFPPWKYDFENSILLSSTSCSAVTLTFTSTSNPGLELVLN
jgi:hypothetical protein